MSTTGFFDPSERVRGRDDALVRDLRRLLDGKLSEDEAALVRFANAEHIRAHLSTLWCRPEAPERPLEFPDDPRELVQRIRFASAVRANSDDKKLAASYGDWRYAVWRSELEGEARVMVLFGAVETYTRLIEANGGDPALERLRDEVLDFMSVEWGFNALVPDTYVERKEVAARLSKREDVLPRWLSALRLPSESGAGNLDGAVRERAPQKLGAMLTGVADRRLPAEPDEDEERP